MRCALLRLVVFRASVRLGGNVNNGANYGLLYFNANNTVSNAHWIYGGGLSLYASQRAGGGASSSASDIPLFPQGVSLQR